MAATNHAVPMHMMLLLAGFSMTAQSAERVAKAVAAKSSQPNLQFLEYLGTLEGDDENWTDVGEAVAVQGSDASANKVIASKSSESGAKGSKVGAPAAAETAKPVERK